MTAPDNYRCHQLISHLSPIGRETKTRVARIVRFKYYSAAFWYFRAFVSGAALSPLTSDNQIDISHIKTRRIIITKTSKKCFNGRRG